MVRFYATNQIYTIWKWWTFNYYVYFIITVNTYLFKYVPVKLGFIILSLIGVLRIPEEFYLYKDKDHKSRTLSRTSDTTETRNSCAIKVILLACFTYIDIF
jgi:putative Mn2+ efflux pump MntP